MTKQDNRWHKIKKLAIRVGRLRTIERMTPSDDLDGGALRSQMATWAGDAESELFSEVSTLSDCDDAVGDDLYTKFFARVYDILETSSALLPEDTISRIKACAFDVVKDRTVV